MPSNVFEAFTTSGTGSTKSTAELNQTYQSIDLRKTEKAAAIDSLNTKITTLNGLYRDLMQPNAASSNDYPNKVSALINNLRDINTVINDYYMSVVQPSQELLRDTTTALNINNQTSLINQKLAQNAAAKKDLEESTEKLSTAYTREATIDTKEDAISYQQAWGYIARPLKKNSIPILIVFTLLFAGIGIVGLWYVSPYSAAAEQILAGEVGFFQHPAVWMTLTILGILALIFGSLKLAKQF